MTRRDVALLREIEEAALDENKSVAGALRKCITLGARAGSPELRDWARGELNGYDSTEVLPAYRVIQAPILVDSVTVRGIFTGQRIAVSQLPDFVAEEYGETVELRYGLGELEAMAHSGKHVSLSLPGGGEIARFMTHRAGGASHINNVYWSVASIALIGVIDRIRTTLVQLVAEIRAGMPDDQDIPSPEVATQALNIAIHGKKARVNVSSAQSVEGSSTASLNSDERAQDGGWSIWRKIGAVVVGLATVAAAVFAFIELA